jgi:hypothetical protein
MFTKRLRAASIFIAALGAQCSIAQPQSENLLLPIAHSGTAITYEATTGAEPRLMLFDGKHQPSVGDGSQAIPLRYSYVVVEPGSTIGSSAWLDMPADHESDLLYPVYATFGGGWTDMFPPHHNYLTNLALVSGNGNSYAYWTDEDDPTTTGLKIRGLGIPGQSGLQHPLNISRLKYYNDTNLGTIIVGSNRGGLPQSEYSWGLHYHGGGPPEGQANDWWMPLTNLTPNGIPLGESSYDIEAWSWNSTIPEGAFETFQVMTADVNPLLSDPGLTHSTVTAEGVYHWCHGDEDHGYQRINPAGGLANGPLVNLQLALRAVSNDAHHYTIYGVGMGSNGEFMSFWGDGEKGDLPNLISTYTWHVREPTPPETHVVPPLGTIPYDLAIWPYSSAALTPLLLAATNNGLWFSADQGMNWYTANDDGDGIKCFELHKIAIEGQPNHLTWHRVAVAGWDACYVGEVNVDAGHDGGYRFDWHEIQYDPELYQHWDHAYTSLGLGANATTMDVALVEHDTDPIMPDRESVVIQTRNAATEINTTVHIGNKDAETRPFMRLTEGNGGDPWIVYNPVGEGGATVKTLIAPDYLTWDSVTLFSETGNAPAKIVDAVASQEAKLISFDVFNGNPGNRLWAKFGTQAWNAISALPAGLVNGLVATERNSIYYLDRPAPGASTLFRSIDQGNTFANVPLPAGFNDLVDYYMAMGRWDDLPPYIAGTVPANGQGRLYRYSPSIGVWARGEVPLGSPSKIAIDPHLNNCGWIAIQGQAGASILPFGYEPALLSFVFGGAWWNSAGIGHGTEYSILDLSLEALGDDPHDRVLMMTLRTPDSNEGGVDHHVTKRWRFHAFGMGDALPTFMEGTWIIDGNLTIPPGQTLMIEAGARLMFLPSAKIIVQGTLQALGTTGNPILCDKLSVDQKGDWSGIEVQSSGTAHLSCCTITGAATAINDNHASSLLVDHCTIQGCGMGVNIYAPSGSGVPQITNTRIVENSQNGIKFLGTFNATVSDCYIGNNALDGILMQQSKAVFAGDSVIHNGYTTGSHYGLNCLASSPTLHCNVFRENYYGEMLLNNGSYPVMWSVDGSAGANVLFNSTKTLIQMTNSYPVVYGGLNSFIVGATGYFMTDLTTPCPVHYIAGNYWNPSPSPNKFYPINRPDLWLWNSTSGPGNCGGQRGMMEGATAELFQQGFDAEMSGDLAVAEATYAQVVTLYPDSDLATAAATRVLDVRRQSDTTFTELQSWYDSLTGAPSMDADLAAVAQDMSTRCLVESREYDPALQAYQEVMANPASQVDSIYAAIDYAITDLRSQYDAGAEGGLDSYRPPTDLATASDLISQLTEMLPKSPEAHHEGYTVLPTTVVLEQNYPNPFNALTTIKYYLPEAANPRLEVFNLIGQKVATLVDGRQPAGYQNVSWNAEQYPSGMYFYRLSVGGEIHSNKLLLLK